MSEKRKARLPISQSDALIAVEEAGIRAALAGWYARRGPQHFDAEASQSFFANDFLARLQRNDETLDAALIADMAEWGHPAADAAVRAFIEIAMVQDTYQDLPVPVKNFARKAVRRAPLHGYPPRTPRVLIDFLRDVAIVRLIQAVSAYQTYVSRILPSGRPRSAEGK